MAVVINNSFIFISSFSHESADYTAKAETTCDTENLVSVSILISSYLCASCVLSSLQVNLALKQKSDIEHYRNKLRLKAKRKGYYDFPSAEGDSSDQALAQRQQHGYERAAGEHGRPLEPDDERGSTYVKSYRR